MSHYISKIVAKWISKKEFPDFRAGDTVAVSVKVKEGEKERIQIYRGLVIKMQGAGHNRAFTVRKVSSGVGVERTFPFSSPSVDKVELIARGQVRRSKLYYLRNLAGRKARLTSEMVTDGEGAAPAAAPTAEPAQKSN